jgi:hypothetical protein
MRRKIPKRFRRLPQWKELLEARREKYKFLWEKQQLNKKQ